MNLTGELLSKRERIDDIQVPRNDRNRSHVDGVPKIMLKFLVSNNIAGSLIGKGFNLCDFNFVLRHLIFSSFK